MEPLRRERIKDKNFEEMLLLRAWVLHSCLSINRLVQYAVNESSLTQEPCLPPKCAEYNTAILDPLVLPLRYTMATLTGVGVILDILCKRYRFLAHYFIYLENWFGVIYELYPV